MLHFSSWLVYVMLSFACLLQIAVMNDDAEKPIVVLLVFDGFRWDYLEKGLTPTLQKFSDEGVRADSLQPVFPTKTFTNMFSIATGMYAENHGIFGAETFHDKKCVRYSQEMYSYNSEITPLWIFNELNGGKSGTIWNGGEFEYRGRKIEYAIPWVRVKSHRKNWPPHVDSVLKWLLNKENPINLAHLYFEQPDLFCHNPGMADPRFKVVMKRVDEIFAYLLRRLEETGLDKKVDVIVVSDHGMAMTDLPNFVDIEFLYNNIPDMKTLVSADEKIKLCEDNPFVHIASDFPDALENVHKKLKALCEKQLCDVFTKDEIPEEWHFKNNSKNDGTLLLVAKYPVGFLNGKKKPESSTHGWDNRIRDMDGFFAARGPHMRKGHFINKKLKNIDIFGLVSYILELDMKHLLVKPNSSLNDIQEALDPEFMDKETLLRQEIRKYFTV